MLSVMLELIKKHSPISIGMRTFKTWLAVTITFSLALTQVIGNPFYAVMGTILGMQNTLSSSFRTARFRIIGTSVGAFIGFLFGYFNLTAPPLMALAVVLVILACRLLKIGDAVFITLTLCLLIMLVPEREGGLFIYTTSRVLDTAVGLVVALVINFFVAPPNYLNTLTQELENLYFLTKKTIEDRSNLPKLKNKLVKLSSLHNNYQADYKYDNHFISLTRIEKAVEAGNYLYFHLKHLIPKEEEAKEHQQVLITDTLNFIEKTIEELKGAL